MTTKKQIQRIIGLATMVAMIMVACFAAAATAHAAAPAPLVKAGQSNISQAAPGKPAHYYPKALSCTRVGGSCSITIKNTTSVSQSVTQNGQVLFTLAHAQSKSIAYTTAGTFTYGLSSNPKTHLTVTVT